MAGIIALQASLATDPQVQFLDQLRLLPASDGLLTLVVMCLTNLSFGLIAYGYVWGLVEHAFSRQVAALGCGGCMASGMVLSVVMSWTIVVALAVTPLNGLISVLGVLYPVCVRWWTGGSVPVALGGAIATPIPFFFPSLAVGAVGGFIALVAAVRLWRARPRGSSARCQPASDTLP